MIDLYMIITPIAGLLALWTVVNLKSALNEPKAEQLARYEKKPSDQNKNNQNDNQPEIQPQQLKQPAKDESLQAGFKKTLLYMLKNWTLAQFCMTRRSRNRIPLILSISMVAVLSVTINLPIVFCFIGLVVTLSFLFGKMLTQTDDDHQQQKPANPQSDVHAAMPRVKTESKFEHKLEVILSSLSLLVNVVFIGLVYKNYRNLFLAEAMQNLLITLVVDNLAVKPLGLVVVAYFGKNVVFVDEFIDREVQVVEIINELRVLKRVVDAPISSLSPRKMVSSPSKVPKAIRVQPRITSQTMDNYISTLQQTNNALKRSRLSPITLKKAQQRNIEGECSLISLMNSHDKKVMHNINDNGSFEFDKELFEEKVHEEQHGAVPEVQIEHKVQPQQIKQTIQHQQDDKLSKLQNSKLLMVSSHNNSIIHDFEQKRDQAENQQQQEDGCRVDDKSTLQKKSLRDSDYNRTVSRNCDNLKISLNRSIHDTIEEKENFEDFFEVDRHHQLRPHSTLEEDNSVLGYGTGRRHDGLLKINQDRKAEDLEEIDLNSPQRRKQQLTKIVEDAQIPKKKKKVGHKKYSLDPNRHVIKHSTGEPYLEFLPNLLNKERQEKRKKSSHQGSQQSFSRRLDLMNGFVNESRMSKSVKRTKNVREQMMKENDENRVPEFVIEDFN